MRLEAVGECCSMLQCVAVCVCVCVAVRYSALQRVVRLDKEQLASVAVSCSMLQSVAECCSVCVCVCVAACCSALQRVAAKCVI